VGGEAVCWAAWRLSSLAEMEEVCVSMEEDEEVSAERNRAIGALEMADKAFRPGRCQLASVPTVSFRDLPCRRTEFRIIILLYG
jgi:hypothetical protein